MYELTHDMLKNTHAGWISFYVRSHYKTILILCRNQTWHSNQKMNCGKEEITWCKL